MAQVLEVLERVEVKYEKPWIKKEKMMRFPLDILQRKSGKYVDCKQCGSCHGCK